MNYLKDDDILTIDVSKNEIQRFCVVSFLTPKYELKNSIFNSINNIINSDINGRLTELTDKIKKTLIKRLSEKVNSKYMIYSKNSTYKNLLPVIKYMKDNFSTIIDKYNNKNLYRPFEFDIGTLDYVFSTYVEENNEELKNKYNLNTTHIRGFKVRGVFNSPESAMKKKFTETNSSIFLVPIGKWIPWDCTRINNKDYVITDEMLNELNMTMKNYLDEIETEENEFNNNLDNIRKNFVTKNNI